MGQRCLTRATLNVIAQETRTWDGVPHVTSLMNGTMMEFLKIVEDYAIKPGGLAFALLGTGHHAKMEEGAGIGGEIHLHLGPVSDPFIVGTTDDIAEDEEHAGFYVLSDYKSWGSYRVAKALGLEKNLFGRWVMNRARADLSEVTLQTNMYRIMAEQQLGIKIIRLQVQITPRDGGIQAAVQRGVTEPMYLVELDIMPDEEVLLYFLSRRAKLLDALDRGVVDDVCTPEENWETKRCKDYCEVAAFCPLGMQVLSRGK